MLTKTCIIDVGANMGDFLFPLATRLPSIPFLGIEPFPDLFAKLETKKQNLNLLNISNFCVAIDTLPSKAKFNIGRHFNGEVSSLLNFDHKSIANNEYWAKESVLYFDEAIDVNVVRLDTLLEEVGYNHVSFIKIDTQGIDLRVLQSLGKFLEVLDAGCLEVATTRNSSVYMNECLLHEALIFLNNQNFEVYAIKPNDAACAYVNIFFNRRGLDWQEIERRLDLRGVPLYDGKHYWHLYSNSPKFPNPELMTQSVQNELLRLNNEIEAMRRSKSWRFTMPLRILKKFISK